MATTVSSPRPADVGARLAAYLDGPWHEQLQAVRRDLSHIAARDTAQFPTPMHRFYTLGRLQALGRTPGFLEGYVQVGDRRPDVGRGLLTLALVGAADLSLFTKIGVQFGLYAGAIQQHGTARHHERYLTSLTSPAGFGCYAATEADHGSDLQSLQTTATFDPSTDEFVIDTPHPGARKIYIGNAAQDGRYAVVLARLITAGEDHGVHEFVVPIRDRFSRPLDDRIRIVDNGRKGGLNGVDNGSLYFDGVRVPREALLDRFAQVDRDGGYHRAMSAGRRMRLMRSTLLGGRAAVALGATGAASTALTIAGNYALTRRQFAGSDGREKLLVEHPEHARLLVRLLASTYALCFAERELARSVDAAWGRELDNPALRELEVTANCLKALATDHAFETLGAARLATGGAGFMAEAQLVERLADLDNFRIFEGSNPVLRFAAGLGLAARFGADRRHADPVETARAVVQQVWGDLREHTPVLRTVDDLVRSLPRIGGEADRLARDVALLTSWEEHLVAKLGLRMQAYEAAGVPKADIGDLVQTHAVQVALVHADNLTVKAIVAAAAHCPDPLVARRLKELAEHHVAEVLDTHSKGMLQHRLLSPERSAANDAFLERSRDVLTSHLPTLVDGLGAPRGCITAQIGQRASEVSVHDRVTPPRQSSTLQRVAGALPRGLLHRGADRSTATRT